MALGGPTLPRITIGRWTRVPKQLLHSIDREKAQLTVLNKAKIAAKRRGFDKDGPDQYELWQEDDTHLWVPRAHQPKLKPSLIRDKDYAIYVDPRLGDADHGHVLGEDNITLGPTDMQPFDQLPAFEALTSKPAWPYGKVLSLRCGAGKTVIALKAAFLRGGRTLWVTTSTSLLEDMLGERKGIPKFLGIPRDEITQVQANKCGPYSLGKKCYGDWRGTSIGVAMLHTLAKREYPQAFYNHWDLVIFDEGDMLATEHFNSVVPRFRAERWLLTATHDRADGMSVLFDKHIGPIVYEHLEYDLQPDCWFVTTEAPPKHVQYAGWRKGERQVSYQLTAKSLLFNEDRNAQMYELLRTATDKGRTVLVFGDSVEGLAFARMGAAEAMPGVSHGLIVGQVKQRDRDDILQNNQVVWATSRLGYRGLDRPAFDTVIVASLCTVNEPFWRQGAGRILRFVPGVEKRPIVCVMVDYRLPPMLGLVAKQEALFRKLGWATSGNALAKLKEMRAERKALAKASRGERRRF